MLHFQAPGRGGQAKIAKRAGLDQGYISRIWRGLCLPSLNARRALFQKCGIPMHFWDEVADETEEVA